MNHHILVRGIFILLFCSALNASLTNAAEPGDPAPPLKIAQWVRGHPIDLAPAGGTNVTVIVFWETGCGVCIATMPQLTELQKKYRARGLVVLGISRDPTNAIQTFLAAHGDKMDFTVAADDRWQTYAAYMIAARESVFPHAFIIDAHGTILWHRHPQAGLDRAVEEILSGHYDLDAERKADRAIKLASQYLTLAKTNSAAPETAALGRRILKDGAVNPWLLNNFAWSILTEPGIVPRDLDLALDAAKVCDDATGKTNSAFADTYARALFDSGKIPEAVAMEKRAVEFSSDARERASFETALRQYQDKLPNR